MKIFSEKRGGFSRKIRSSPLPESPNSLFPGKTGYTCNLRRIFHFLGFELYRGQG